MRRIMRSRPSPAIIVAVVALVAALAGTAVAGPGANSSVITGAKVVKKANKVFDSRLPITSAELGTINTRTATENVPNNQFGEATANCQTGEKVISGGVRHNSFFVYLQETYRQGEGWFGKVVNFSGGAVTLTVEAYCLTA
jgi:hypothetical protein